MRIIIKGGVWKNTEDEILKAAVSKYGKNQWARISSLLVRKSPKQCKARWYEWLDPSIKKTEWSKEEDEKLLHLAKLMPTQWRTIAPIVGRTPAQCLERYQRLLDEAEAKESIGGGHELGLTGVTGPESVPSADDVRRLRPGEIDPDPETKPARPDPVDMDEDEKEMLSEARARLANTQGKKAKRKARERQLEEARRLATLQKRRELKAAGIELKVKKKKRIPDYNIDVPLEKKPAIGFYDATEELNKPKESKSFTNIHLSKLEKRLHEEEEEKKKAKKRKQDGKEGGTGSGFVPAAANAQLQKLKEAEQISKRRKLILPAPQVGEGELEEIVKIGLAGESVKSMVDDSDNQATKGLLGNYSVTTSNVAARTPRVPAAQDNIMLEARNLRNLTIAQTPLLGDENTPLHQSQSGTGFEGATPRRVVQQTPNPMMTPLRGVGGKLVGQTPLRTPFRDELSINERESDFGETPREERLRRVSQKNTLRQSLLGLPAPKNEFEIVIPDVDAKKDDTVESSMEQDMSDVDRKNMDARMASEKAQLERRSTVVKKGLPRPVSVDAKALMTPPSFDQEDDSSVAARLIDEEMLKLLRHDQLKYPVAGSNVAPGSIGHIEDVENEFTDKLMERARATLAEEFERMELPEEVPGLENLWNRVHSELVFSPNIGKFVGVDEVEDEERTKGLEKILESNRSSMSQDATRAEKLEKKLSIHLGGYQARSKSLRQKIRETFDELDNTSTELSSYHLLQVKEKGAIPSRVESLEREVDFLVKRERNLQTKYKELMERKEMALRKIRELEDIKATRLAIEVV